jgi:hypothetical protein
MVSMSATVPMMMLLRMDGQPASLKAMHLAMRWVGHGWQRGGQ